MLEFLKFNIFFIYFF